MPNAGSVDIYHERRERQSDKSASGGGGGQLGVLTEIPEAKELQSGGLCGSAPMNFGSWWAKVGKAGEEIGLCAAKKRVFVGLGPQSTSTGREN